MTFIIQHGLSLDECVVIRPRPACRGFIMKAHQRVKFLLALGRFGRPPLCHLLTGPPYTGEDATAFALRYLDGVTLGVILLTRPRIPIPASLTLPDVPRTAKEFIKFGVHFLLPRFVLLNLRADPRLGALSHTVVSAHIRERQHEDKAGNTEP